MPNVVNTKKIIPLIFVAKIPWILLSPGQPAHEKDFLI